MIFIQRKSRHDKKAGAHYHWSLNQICYPCLLKLLEIPSWQIRKKIWPTKSDKSDTNYITTGVLCKPWSENTKTNNISNTNQANRGWPSRGKTTGMPESPGKNLVPRTQLHKIVGEEELAITRYDNGDSWKSSKQPGTTHALTQKRQRRAAGYHAVRQRGCVKVLEETW